MIALTKSKPTTLIPTTTVPADKIANKIALNLTGILRTFATSVSTPTANICLPQKNRATIIAKLIRTKANKSELDAVVSDQKR